jgi:hypothetical protein
MQYGHVHGLLEVLEFHLDLPAWCIWLGQFLRWKRFWIEKRRRQVDLGSSKTSLPEVIVDDPHVPSLRRQGRDSAPAESRIRRLNPREIVA